MNRIASAFEGLQSKGRKALIPFITAGDPRPAATVPLMHALVAAGADIIELGVPFSDPMADGPAIQRASERALANGVSLRNALEFAAAFRAENNNTPVVLMGYANPIEAMGIESFAATAKNAGVDGVLVVDYPPEEARELAAALGSHLIDSIFLLAPTSTAERMRQVSQVARGYVYYVSLKGVTGAAHLDLTAIKDKLPRIREHIKLPIGVGFGIRDEQSARAVARIADAVVIGSRIVEEIESSPPEKMLHNVSHFVSRIRAAIDQGSGSSIQISGSGAR